MNTKLNENFGKLAVDLGLEKVVLADGILPERTVEERSKIITGMVHHLLRKGKWREAVTIRYEDGRQLYDQTLGNFGADLLAAIKPEEIFPHNNYRSDKTIELLLEKGESETIKKLALMKNMPFRFREYLVLKTFDQDEQKEQLLALGKEIQEKWPLKAYEMFDSIGNEDAINELKQYLVSNLTLDNLADAFNIAGKISSREGSITNLTEIARKGTSLLKSDSTSIARMIYNNVKGKYIELSEKEMEKLVNLTIQCVYATDILSKDAWGKSKYEELRIPWAKAKWEEYPAEAYRIFVEKDYHGKEVIPCAIETIKLGFNPTQSERSKVRRIIEEDLQKILETADENDYELREYVALELDAKEELVRLGKLQEDMQHRYKLFIAGGLSQDDSLVEEVRKKLIEKDIMGAAGKDFGPLYFHWLEDSDQKGFKLCYEALLEGRKDKSWAGEAYKLAVTWKDDERVERAREVILSRNEPSKALWFFTNQKDETGKQKASEAIAQKYEIPAEQVQLLTEKMEI